MPRTPITDPIPIEDLLAIFRYDHNTGTLIRISTGTAAGIQWKTANHNLYGHVTLPKCRRAHLHRVVFAVVHGRWPEDQIIHIDGDTTNNRVENLREKPELEIRHSMKRYINNTSGYTGVRRTASGKWQALITDWGRRVCLGTFADVEDAAAAYRAKADELGYPEYHGQ